ncbi:S-type pyocin domain-containing protein [Pseudomonas guariconensis]|uniref:S-type pyocin domain-containing protein n=1 Tax=Pseudomonas TaxID=286 RepID=UPI002096C18C|nr:MULTISPECIES: S-type pyocin domain-containing protein [Pseudomonas]MCO7637098.1 S-type pyocin domain-containing protein [Pseudomonas sp. S 311-6]MCO7515820.1 S-type pyocin domain-containing protein [Pseudomonas putida]MCO7566131.1 S-type pyocin domain-containing protein [Pseudomonas mosselii]MCO7605820.1 S-type pyocin domain-containing protein [Pseudomonas guariconensis]MCO7617123.1 S-type pyocin domain-containing protein [Pseudomonas guariconensis]
MAIGHFIRLGDKTTCGGTVLEADSHVMMFGIMHAREGDRVSCGKDGKVYRIIGGISYINSHGRVVAGSLDSFSGCPCKARLIPSLLTPTYRSHQGDSAAATRRATSHPASAASPAPSAAPTKLANPPITTDKLLRTACAFTKCSKLPDSVIDYSTSSGAFPVDSVNDYGHLVLLAGREVDDSGKVQLKKISGDVPAGFGSLALRGLAPSGAGESCGGLCEVVSAGGAVASGGRVAVGASGRAVGSGILSGGLVGGALLGVVAMLWPSSLGDSALYTEEQLRTMKQGRTRVRIRVEQQPDGRLKGYGYNTQLRSDWEMIPVVQFTPIGSQMVADFGGGVELIWTPAANPSDTLGIPALEAAPQAPQITIYPPVEQADKLIVDPIYPPEYRDFILVFPAGSGIAPLYIVMNARHDPGVVTGRGEDVSGIWLAGAGEGIGAPIPTRVADRLRGREFSRFDDFREAFWKEVAADPELSIQFSAVNRRLMRGGSSPFVAKSEAVGGRKVHELHHIERIADGGTVYDLDNLRVATPRNHIRIHRANKGQ